MISTKDGVLAALAESSGRCVSGASLARSLTVTRTAVWKAIAALKEDGYDITSEPKGYILKSECDILNKARLESYIKTEGYNVIVLDSVNSTNTYLKHLAQDGAPELTIVISREQTGGRGRLGRSFYSPKDSGIYLSILLRPTIAATEALRITTTAAVIVSEAIENVLGIKTDIKWVNDIYSGDRKVCGILTEASVDLESGSLEYAIVGIGINVEPPKNGFPTEISNVADSLCSSGAADTKNRLVATICDGISNARGKLLDLNYVAEYKKRSMLDGRTVTVIKPNGEAEALVIGIDDDFRLIVEYGNKGRESLASGEVRIKLK